jgi:uncharacterized alpha/beta hydrolase family protein
MTTELSQHSSEPLIQIKFESQDSAKARQETNMLHALRNLQEAQSIFYSTTTSSVKMKEKEEFVN